MTEPKPIPGPSPGPSPDRPAPAPATKPGPAAAVKRPVAATSASRFYVAKSSKREVFIAVGIALGVLAIIVWGIYVVSKEPSKPSRNFLSGTIVAKHDIGEREQLLSVGRSKGVDIKQGETGYSFDVKVGAEGRIYELPVTKKMYESKKVGDRQDFIRPKSEQR
jgi:hypothetical protein